MKDDDLKPYYDHAGIMIYHGDCRDITPGLVGPFDLILTDPPYGHNNNNNDLIHKMEAVLGRGPAQDNRPIVNDGPEEAAELVEWLYTTSAERLKAGCCCCCCCCGGGGPAPQFARWALLMDKYLNFKQMVVWDKGPMGMGWHYRRSYETVLVGEKAGAPCRWFGDRKVENIIRPSDNTKKIIPNEREHPTPKPVGLMGIFIRNHTDVGDLVFDPFMGGGTTLVAAKQLGRRAIGIEVEEKYCEMAARRLSQDVLFGND